MKQTANKHQIDSLRHAGHLQSPPVAPSPHFDLSDLLFMVSWTLSLASCQADYGRRDEPMINDILSAIPTFLPVNNAVSIGSISILITDLYLEVIISTAPEAAEPNLNSHLQCSVPFPNKYCAQSRFCKIQVRILTIQNCKYVNQLFYLNFFLFVYSNSIKQFKYRIFVLHVRNFV